MATDKKFSVCGISTVDGQTKMRFATDVMRVKVLAKGGHQDITLIELPEAMPKVDAVKFVAQLPEFQDELSKQTIADYLDKNDKQAKVERKAAKGPAVRAHVSTTVTEANSELEDAPF